MKPLPRFRRLSCNLSRPLFLGLSGASLSFAAPVAMNGAGSYTQNFDTLPNSGTTNAWTNDATVAGWYAAHTNLANILVGAGAGTSGGLYSYGVVGETERALGSLCSNSSGAVSYGLLLQNTGTQAVTINSLAFAGEQWRNGGNTTAHKLTLFYQKSTEPVVNPGATTGWTAVAAGDFTGPVATGTAAVLNGNLPENRAAINTNPAIPVAPGEYVMLRWLDANDSGNDHGLGIDDVAVSWGVAEQPILTLTADPTLFAENAGAAASTGTVKIPAALAQDLVIALSSSDTTEATVPATVTIPAGETSATFPISAVDDLLADGSQSVAIKAVAAGYADGTVNVSVENDTDAFLDVQIAPPTIAENGGDGAATGTVTLAEFTPVDVVVTLVSNKPDEATVPASVTIPANSNTVTFPVNAVMDGEVDGSQSVRIDASAEGYTPGWRTLTVTDVDVPPTPTLTPGAIAFTGFNVDGNDDLAFVALTKIPAGEIVFFNDNEWSGGVIGDTGAFNTGEGVITWVAPASGVEAGTVVQLNNLGLATRSASVGTLSASGSFNLGGSGETLYAYQGTSATAVTGFLAVIANGKVDSIENTGLDVSHVIYLTDGTDIGAYTGARNDKPAFAGYLASLGDSANWAVQDGSGDQSIDATAPDVPFDVTPFVLGTAVPGYTEWAAANAGGGAPGGDFDGDGVSNGVEYFMGAAAGQTTTPQPVGGKVTWPHSAAAHDATFKVFSSTDLSTWTDVTAQAVDADGKVEYTLPQGAAQIFVRLEVSIN